MKKNILKNICMFVLSFVVIFLPLYLLNADVNVTNSPIIENPLGGNNGDLASFFKNLLSQLAKLAAMLAIVMIILTGLRFVLAQGDPGKIKTAKTQLLYVVIGTAIILGAALIVDVVVNTIKSLSTT